MEVREAKFKIEINGKDATKQLTPYLLSLTFTDHISGKADEIAVDLDNSTDRFLNAWFMTPGMVVKVWIDDVLCGRFTIDYTHEKLSPDIATFRAQSAEFSTPIRTRRTFTHSDKSLADIVKKYADDNKLKLSGTIPDIQLINKSQLNKSDIHYLHKLADKYGCICSVKGGVLVFDLMENIYKKAISHTIKRADMMQGSNFTTSLADADDEAATAYYDPHTEKVEGSIVKNEYIAPYAGGHATADDGSVDQYAQFGSLPVEQYRSRVPGEDFVDFTYAATGEPPDYNTAANKSNVTLTKVGSTEEAKRVSMGNLLRAQRRKHTCNIKLPGNIYVLAGNSVDIQEVGKRSGWWLVEKSVHTILRSGGKHGYITEFEGTHGAARKTKKTAPSTKVPANVNSKGTGNYVDDVPGTTNRRINGPF